jgi:hypothetical protein
LAQSQQLRTHAVSLLSELCKRFSRHCYQAGVAALVQQRNAIVALIIHG